MSIDVGSPVLQLKFTEGPRKGVTQTIGPTKVTIGKLKAIAVSLEIGNFICSQAGEKKTHCALQMILFFPASIAASFLKIRISIWSIWIVRMVPV